MTTLSCLMSRHPSPTPSSPSSIVRSSQTHTYPHRRSTPSTALNTPQTWSRSIRPVEIIAALSEPVRGGRGGSPLFSSREHQDAQELFQLVTEAVSREAAAAASERARDRGLGALSPPPPYSATSPPLSPTLPPAASSSSVSSSSSRVRAPFDGLTANRRSCVECGYTEAVMHFAFDNWQLPVPPSSVRLPA